MTFLCHSYYMEELTFEESLAKLEKIKFEEEE